MPYKLFVLTENAERVCDRNGTVKWRKKKKQGLGVIGTGTRAPLPQDNGKARGGGLNMNV